MYGITLIFVLAVVGGVIALIGDRLGTRIGKKKLSIFGLRPRHTAVLVTVVTGICITTVTFGIMAAVCDHGSGVRECTHGALWHGAAEYLDC